jgi:hypothetical protein
MPSWYRNVPSAGTYLKQMEGPKLDQPVIYRVVSVKNDARGWWRLERTQNGGTGYYSHTTLEGFEVVSP